MTQIKAVRAESLTYNRMRLANYSRIFVYYIRNNCTRSIMRPCANEPKASWRPIWGMDLAGFWQARLPGVSTVILIKSVVYSIIVLATDGGWKNFVSSIMHDAICWSFVVVVILIVDGTNKKYCGQCVVDDPSWGEMFVLTFPLLSSHFVEIGIIKLDLFTMLAQNQILFTSQQG